MSVAFPPYMGEVMKDNDPQLKRNMSYVRPGSGPFFTTLNPQQEKQFRTWVRKNNVEYNINAPANAPGNREYDMRGFWLGLQNHDPHTMTGVDPNDHHLHYTDWWKTPYDRTFSNASKFAVPGAPHWEGNRLITKSRRLVYDDKMNSRKFLEGLWNQVLQLNKGNY